MRNIFSILIFLLAITVCHSQSLPKIGLEKDVKEKFILIKKGLPNIKKNLTKQDETFTDEYNVKFEMGDGIGNFDELEDGELLTIKYSSKPYFSGSIEDFQNYYNKLITIITEVFGATHTSIVEKTNTSWTTIFFEKGKDQFNSKTSIRITVSWILNDPHISIAVASNK